MPLGVGAQNASESMKRGIDQENKGLDIVDTLWKQIDDMKKTRDAKTKADQDYQVGVHTLNLNAQHYGIGSVAEDPKTGKPVLKPFTQQEQQNRVAMNLNATLDAFGIPHAPLQLQQGANSQAAAAAPQVPTPQAQAVPHPTAGQLPPDDAGQVSPNAGITYGNMSSGFYGQSTPSAAAIPPLPSGMSTQTALPTQGAPTAMKPNIIKSISIGPDGKPRISMGPDTTTNKSQDLANKTKYESDVAFNQIVGLAGQAVKRLKSAYIQQGGSGPIAGAMGKLRAAMGDPDASQVSAYKEEKRQTVIAMARQLSGGSRGAVTLFNRLLESFPDSSYSEKAAADTFSAMTMSAYSVKHAIDKANKERPDLNTLPEEDAAKVIESYITPMNNEESDAFQKATYKAFQKQKPALTGDLGTFGPGKVNETVGAGESAEDPVITALRKAHPGIRIRKATV